MKSALLVIDVQQALCAGQWTAFDMDPVVDRIDELAAKARSAGTPVFLIQHEETEGALHASLGFAQTERVVFFKKPLRSSFPVSDDCSILLD